MNDPDLSVQAIADRHGLSSNAVRALADALAAGGGGGAQWAHPDLGGMGQWLRGGLLQIGDMFNDGLKARVRGALGDLVARNATPGVEVRSRPDFGDATPWPAAWGTPSATGAQDGLRYACFPDVRRLVVERDGRRTVYDTGASRLTGFAQSAGELAFNGPDGRVRLDDLRPIVDPGGSPAGTADFVG